MTKSLCYFSACAIVLLTVGGLPSSEPDRPADTPTERSKTVLDFGARGDGRADDTAAIQKAVDSGIGNVRFPKGVYRITKPIVIDLDKLGYTSIHGHGVARIEMAGPGPALRFVGTHFKSADPGGFADNVWDRQRMPLVDGISIVGKHEAAVGIEAEGTMQLTISRVHVRKVLHGIHLVKNNRNVAISDCHIYENHGVGIYYDNVNLHQSNISNCHISYNAQGGIVSRKGNVRNIHITGCDLESNMSPDTEPTANVLIDCRGSTAGTAEVAITGCTIQHNNPSPGSANIRIIGRSLPSRGQQIVREGNVTISGNVLSDVKINIHLKDCRGVAITGNTLWQGYEHNLLVEDSSNVVIGPNNLDRNPRYNYGNTRDANNSIV
ncbi:MAG: right-handed parallel beta-helix repeat-containing protein, partial [Planctomycetes bacterium]|nr:right-handed parallel beta-helix repeat-containing protein [Planctomycetota bacterium]